MMMHRPSPVRDRASTRHDMQDGGVHPVISTRDAPPHRGEMMTGQALALMHRQMFPDGDYAAH